MQNESLVPLEKIQWLTRELRLEVPVVLVELIYEYLISEYNERVRDILDENKNCMRYDIEQSLDYYSNIQQRVEIPIEYIRYDWKLLFNEVPYKNYYYDEYICGCKIIPETIRVVFISGRCSYLPGNWYGDTIRYTCPKCKKNVILLTSWATIDDYVKYNTNNAGKGKWLNMTII